MGNPRLACLQQWLQAHGVTWHPELTITRIAARSAAVEEQDEAMNYSSTALGVFLRSADVVIGRDTIVSSIPLQAILSRRTSSLGDSSLPDDLDAHLLLAAHVLHEQLLGGRSEWYGYLQSLPTIDELCLPHAWPPDARQWLLGTELERVLLMEDGRTGQAWFNHVQGALSVSGVRYDGKPSRQAYEHAVGLVTSRAFVVDNYHGLSMVPLADMCAVHRPSFVSEEAKSSSFNHAADPHVTLQSDDIVCPSCGSLHACAHDGEPLPVAPNNTNETDASRCVEMVALRDIAGGGEVFNTYTASKAMPDALLLSRYGFSLPANPADVLCFPSLPRKQDIVEVSAQLRELIAGDEGEACFIDADAKISLAMWRACQTPQGVLSAIKQRQQGMGRPDLSIEELFELQETAQRRAVRLAIGNAINERLILSACEAAWEEVAASAEQFASFVA